MNVLGFARYRNFGEEVDCTHVSGLFVDIVLAPTGNPHICSSSKQRPVPRPRRFPGFPDIGSSNSPSSRYHAYEFPRTLPDVDRFTHDGRNRY